MKFGKMNMLYKYLSLCFLLTFFRQSIFNEIIQVTISALVVIFLFFVAEKLRAHM